MVTARQVGRGVARTIRAMERDAQWRQRQSFAHEKAMARQAMLDVSAEAADTYERFIRLLTQSHQAPFDRRDWARLALADPPAEPARSDGREQAAAAALARYAPDWIDRLFGLAKGKRAKLSAAVTGARAADDRAFAEAVEAAGKRRDEIELAQSVVAGDPQALTAALHQHADFSGLAIEGLNVLFSDGRVIALVDGLEPDDLPTHSISLLQSGKMSRKPLAATKLVELHRDTLCCAAIGVAAEFLRALPLDAVEVVVNTDLLDRGTGHIASQPVLYARVTAQALAAVNLPMAEASPLAERLGAHFDWGKRDGVRPINLGAFDVPTHTPAEEPA